MIMLSTGYVIFRSLVLTMFTLAIISGYCLWDFFSILRLYIESLSSSHCCMCWLCLIIIAAKGNQKLDHYHLGAYGHSKHNQWSCCDKQGRNAPGCKPVTQSKDLERRNSLPPGHGVSENTLSRSKFSQSVPTSSFFADAQCDRYCQTL